MKINHIKKLPAIGCLNLNTRRIKSASLLSAKIFTTVLFALFFVITPASSAFAERLPRPSHIVVVIEENRGYSQIMDQRNSGSYIHALAKRGMLFTQSYGVTHPSQPNYLALFAGSTFDVTSNACGYSFTTDNLATALLDKGYSFASYAESLPSVGDLSCMSGAYQRKHNPITNWQGTRLPAEINFRFSEFPQNFSNLPTVSFIIPDQNNDMHDGSFEDADAWLKAHIDLYVKWAFKHNSLLILTWDEDSGREDNRVVTLLIGPMVKQDTNSQRINHYNVLRTMLDMYGLPALGESVNALAIKGVWKKR
jgi:phosphatidylinositol-3-phosphatase